MLFSSGLFFALFILFFPIYILMRRCKSLRIIYVTLFSLYFYFKSSGVFVLLLILAATSDFIIGKTMSRTESKRRMKALATLSVFINLGILSYFKYFNYLADVGIDLLHHMGVWFLIPQLESIPPVHADIFLPVGISFYTFQTMSYIIDIYRGRIKPLNRWIDYLFYVSFFPQLVAGPIVRAHDFIPQIYQKPRLTRNEFGEALYLIIIGLLKKAVISDYISLNFVDRIFDAPNLYTGLENLLGVYGYSLQIYCDFSGYSDMAIGIALLMGFRFNINFDLPYQSATITEFWRRWHISLSSWLKDYLYISLGGNRKGRIRTYINLIITMLLGGLWHGAATRFIIWGGLHGVGLAVHKFFLSHFKAFKKTGAEMSPLRRFIGVMITFHLVAFGWIYFRASSMDVAANILHQIFYNFHGEILPQFISGYQGVFILMLIGYVLHFLPKRFHNGARGIISNSPFVLQCLYLMVAIFIVYQMKSSGVQPFIYFQF
nr:MBOAT family protein [Porphyromonas pogonae]